MLKYTGHPLVDVGLATMTAFANKDSPEELVEADLEAITEFMEREYIKQPLKSYLTVAFTSNAWFIQDAYNPNPKGKILSEQERENRLSKRKELSDAHLRQWSSASPRNKNLQCAFTAFPAIAVELSGKLLPGKAARCQIPLFQGDEAINFFAYGDAGLPISGEALLAIQALPLGSAKCGGRLFFIHSDNQKILRYFAQKFLEQNRSAIQLAQLEGTDKMPEPTRKYRTLLVEMLVDALRVQNEQRQDGQPFSLTAYHLTNSGQNPDLSIYHFPTQFILYLRDMLTATYKTSWGELVRRAWEMTTAKKGETAAPEPARNYLYEDLFGVAEDPARNAPRFIRTYFMRQAFRFAKDKIDPRGDYSIQKEFSLVSWKLTEPFLRRIVHMEPQRIENIRQMGDALATYIQQQNDRRFFRNFYVAGRYDYLRNDLIKANTEHVRRGNKPFLTLDSYISVFEEGEEVARVDWRLARDLVLIRMVEQLYNNGWLGANQDAIPEAPAEENTTQE